MKGYISFVLIGIALFAFLIASGFINNLNPQYDGTKYILVTPTPIPGKNTLQLQSLQFISVKPTPVPSDTQIPLTLTPTQGLTTTPPLPTPTTSSSLSGLKISGNKIVDANGNQIVLRGVNRSGTEYACIQGNGIFDGPNTAASLQAITSWKVHVIRVPLNEDCWLNINGVNPAYGGANYQNALAAYVNLANQNGLYVIVDLHWNAPGSVKATGQQVMADADHAPAFWTSVANTFKGNNNVIFDLYNEPQNISWTCWKNGGTSCIGSPFAIAGMQQLITAVRSTGATNILMLGGLSYSNDLSGWLANEPTDTLNPPQLAASWHVYGKNTCDNVTCWNMTAAPVAQQVPLITGEFGESYDSSICATTNDGNLVTWLDSHNLGYLAWVWDTWGTSCGNLSLITDYAGTPHAPNGVWYKAHLGLF